MRLVRIALGVIGVLRPGAESLAAGFEGAEEPADSTPAQLAHGRRGAM